MRRLAEVVCGGVLSILLVLVLGGRVLAESDRCPSEPCASSPAGAAAAVVDRAPPGEPRPTETGVLDRESSASVAPAAVTAAGLLTLAAALRMAVSHRRRALEADLSVPLEPREPAAKR